MRVISYRIGNIFYQLRLPLNCLFNDPSVQSKKLKLEIKRSAAEKTPLHEDVMLLKKLLISDVTGYTHHTLG